MNDKRISIFYDIPISASCLFHDEVILQDIRFGNSRGITCLETNCYEFLNSKYLFDKTINEIYVNHSDYWLKFILSEDGKHIHCYRHNKIIYSNISEVNNLRKMYEGGLFRE